MVPPKSAGSLINEVYEGVFCLRVNLSGDDRSAATVLWLQQFYDMFERRGLRSNGVLRVHVPSVVPLSHVPSVFMLSWPNASVKDSDVNVVQIATAIANSL